MAMPPPKTHSSLGVFKGMTIEYIIILVLWSICWLIMTTDLDLLGQMHTMLSFLIYPDVFELIFLYFLVSLLIPVHLLIVQTILSPLTGLITSTLTKYRDSSMDASF